MDSYSEYNIKELEIHAKWLAKDHSAKLVRFFIRVRNSGATLIAILRYKNGTEAEASMVL